MNKIANVGYDRRVGYDGVVYVIEQTTASELPPASAGGFSGRFN